MRKTWSKPFMLILLAAMFALSVSSSAFAHENNGKGNNAKNSGLDAATAVTMIVKGLDLNIDNLRFIKEPKASDYYTKVKDTSAYAKYFIIAQYNGLELPKDINPSAKVTREQFAKWLFGALSHKQDNVWIQIYVNIADAGQVTKGYMDSIQKLLIAKIATLDGKQKFYPKIHITRTQATSMIDKTVKYIAATKPTEPQPETPVLTDAKLTVEKETDAVLKVTLSALAPHPGYGIEITGIQFANGQAIIQYKAIQPDPNKMYAQVITELKTVTYVSSAFKPVLSPLSASVK
ncbi:S-layer homology domain-containing protein [Cohnella endophytica]|uniref:S-layer homology domain-containing protein n=1 Tax=Cohnella endophytica TaxID=2419778 RepID=A0A494Y5W7_9BACL|nr:protease complex subunit PrcB family protein [Cohnella endophytica]RKP55310.1 S-layer homology domain-containing protein [Cohnella endophytica]